MSLMNDALRKKSREIMVSPVAKGFIDVSDRPRITRRWIVVLAGLTLLTVAVFYGNHVMQSSTGNSLLVTTPRPGNFRPPVTHPADTTSDIQHRPAVETTPASADRPRESVAPGEPTQVNRLTTADVDQAPPSHMVKSDMPDSRIGEPDPALQAVDEKPVFRSAARTAVSIEATVEPAQGEPSAVSRNFEPGSIEPSPRLAAENLHRKDENRFPVRSLTPPQAARNALAIAVQPHPREKSRPVTSRQPSAPAQHVPSPAADPPPGNVGKLNAGDTAPKKAPSREEADLFYKKARAYHRNGHLAEAIRLYRHFLKAHSSHPDAMLNLAAATMQQGNYLEAAPLLKRLERSNPRPRGVLLNLAMAEIGMGSPDKALDYLDRATAVSDATPWEIRFHRAVAFARMNRLPEALNLYREAETERPDDPRLQFNLAVTCDALGYYPEAVTHYEAVLRNPAGPSASDKETITRRIRTLRRYLDTAQSPATGQ